MIAPWRVKIEIVGPRVASIKELDKVIAVVGSDHLPLSTNIDNAIMMAAAPQLLCACRKTLSWFESNNIKDSAPRVILDAAIKKAYEI